MTRLTRTKLSAYLAVIFVAGVVSGGVVTLRRAEMKSNPPTMEKACDRMHRQLKGRLGLSDVEFDRIRPVLDQSAREIQQIHSRTLHEIDAVLRRQHDELARFLTPEQQRKLEELDTERRHWMLKRGKRQGQQGEGPCPSP